MMNVGLFLDLIFIWGKVKQVPMRLSSLSGDDVFILDLGLVAYKWTGSTANKDER